jgi:hypothetical protein
MIRPIVIPSHPQQPSYSVVEKNREVKIELPFLQRFFKLFFGRRSRKNKTLAWPKDSQIGFDDSWGDAFEL